MRYIQDHIRVWIGLLVVMVVIVMAIIGCNLLTSPKSTPTLTTTAPGAPDATSATTDPTSVSGTSEAPPQLATYTPTVAFIATIIVDQVDVHKGPGNQFPVLTTIDEPISVRVIGVNEPKTWFFILLPDNQQGWIPVDAVAYEFDINMLPVVKETPLPPTPYGAKMLVPPQLLGVSPASPRSPARGVLSLLAVIGLAILVLGASGALDQRKRSRRLSFLRLLQSLISLL